MSVLHLDVYQCIALAADAPTFRALAATASELRRRLNEHAVQQEAKRRFARQQVEWFAHSGAHRTFLLLPNGAKHGEEAVWARHKSGIERWEQDLWDDEKRYKEAAWLRNDKCVYRCQWSDGERHGREEWFDLSGALIHQTQWHNGERYGVEEWLDSSGALVHRVQWAHGRRVGNEVPVREGAGQSSERAYTRTVAGAGDHGPMISVSDNLLTCRHPMVWGNSHGPYEKWNAQGRRILVNPCEAGHTHGTVQHWNDKGMRTHVSRRYYSTRQGRWEEWNDDGVLVLQAHYDSHRLDGVRQIWNEEGQATSFEIYDHGELIASRQK